MTVETEITEEIRSSIFRKIMSSFSNLWVPKVPFSCPDVVHLELRHEMLDKRALQALNGRKRLFLQIGWQVTEEELQEQIPPEYIGRLSHLSAGKLVSQSYLQIQVKCVEKTRIAYLPIFPAVPLDPSFAVDSKSFPWSLNF